MDVTIRVVGQGTTEPPPMIYGFPAGTLLKVEAFPDEGWEFDHFVIEPGGTYFINPITEGITENKVITAYFTVAEPGEGGGPNWKVLTPVIIGVSLLGLVILKRR